MTDSPNLTRDGSARGFSPRVLGFTVALSALATLAVVLVVFHVLDLAPWSSLVFVQNGNRDRPGPMLGAAYTTLH